MLLFFRMLLQHNGVTYEFDYDFAPNDGTPSLVMTVVADEQGRTVASLDGAITVDGRPRPVTAEVLGLLERAAALAEIEHQRQEWNRRLGSAAESRRERISLVPRQD
jgi:hypothetical protein